MTNSPDEYQAPSPAKMKLAQNEPDSLRLLLAQRRLYSRSKRWLGARWLGMAMIVISAPIVSLIWPHLAVVAGAVAGAWIFLSRTILLQLERKNVEQAAAVQETFDFQVFGMPPSGGRNALPTLEELVLLSGPDHELMRKAKEENLLDWYPLEPARSGDITVAICQRANASYSDRLLKTTATVWFDIALFWSVGLVIASFVMSLSFPNFLLGILLPVLPAFLDVIDYWRALRRASRDRRDLVTAVEAKLDDGARHLEAQDLLVWQSRLFDVRRTGPQVPDFIYKLTRKLNESAMTTAAAQVRRATEKEQ